MVAGYAEDGLGGERFAAVRLNTDGTLDNGFDGDGVVLITIEGHDQAHGVVVQPDGRIVLPQKVREKMGFAGDLPGDAEAALAGFTNRFRLYRREVYDAELAEDEDDDIDPLTLVGRHKRTG